MSAIATFGVTNGVGMTNAIGANISAATATQLGR
jgi:hypothetical protein